MMLLIIFGNIIISYRQNNGFKIFEEALFTINLVQIELLSLSLGKIVTKNMRKQNLKNEEYYESIIFFRE
jgi:hypothetical protein